METTIQNKKEMINAKDSKALTEKTKSTLNFILDFANKNEYRYKNFMWIFEDKTLEVDIQSETLNLRKKLRNHLWKVNTNPTIEKINKFFKFLIKEIIGVNVEERLEKSDKQLSIEEKRKKYTNALAIAKKVYADYKEEKGDFYKKRVINHQKIQ